MKRKRETAPGGFWSKLTSFFTSTPEEDKEVPSPKKNNEQSHSRLSDHDEEPRALDQSKRRRVANTEELPPTPQVGFISLHLHISLTLPHRRRLITFVRR